MTTNEQNVIQKIALAYLKDQIDDALERAEGQPELFNALKKWIEAERRKPYCENPYSL